MGERICEAKGCDCPAAIGIQLILASNETRHATRWLCMPCLPHAFTEMADMVTLSAALVKVLKGTAIL